MDTLKLVLAKRSGGARQSARDYYDFLINKKSIKSMIKMGDIIGTLWENESPAWNNRMINQLLLNEKSELESGRVPLYVCPECGDLGCGAVTVKITRNESAFIWSEFGYENNYEENILERYDIGVFWFNVSEYQGLFSPLLRSAGRFDHLNSPE